jgi:hypothetical protein
MLVNMKTATRMFVAGAAATAVLTAPMAAVAWTDAAAGGTNVTTSADPGHPGCTDVNGAPCGPGNASASVPGANATAGPGNASASVPGANANAGPGNASASVPGANANAGPGNASASVPGANANAGPGYFNGCITSWCWNAGG